ncbi:MAG: caspase family protein, partial [bacterium]
KDSLVASLDNLAGNWRRMQAATTRNVSANSGWCPATRDYVLLAACRANESAYEYAFDGKETNGALTYWLLNSMEEMGLGLTYNQLNDRIVAKVHSQFETQTPQLEGDGTRVVFGSEHLQPTYTAMVMQADEPNHRVLLNAGQAHGIRKGAEFAIYSQLEADVTKVSSRLGIACVEHLGATDSWSAVTHLSAKPIEQGAQAVLINPGAVKLLRKVKVTHQSRHAEALNHAIRESAWLESAANNEAADYQVTIAETGTYQINDRVGIPLSNQTPGITRDDPNGVARLIQRLEHITRYQAVQELDNYDPTSPLAGKLQVEWAGYQVDYERGEKMDPVPFATRGDTPEVAAGQCVFLRVKNLAATVLNVMVLNLQPDWGIAQVHPAPPSWFASFDPGQEQLIPFDVDLPAQYSQGRDVMKVFATIGSANFRWLQLPPLDQETKSVRRNGDLALSPVDRLLATIASERPPSRNLIPAAHPSAEWTTAQVAIEVHRSALDAGTPG